MKKNKFALATAIAMTMMTSTSFASPATEVDKISLDEAQLEATNAVASGEGTENVFNQALSKMVDSDKEVFEGVSEGVLGISDSKVRPTIGITAEERFFAPHLSGGVKSDNIKYNGGEVDWKDTLGLSNENSPETILRYKNMSLDWIHYHSVGEPTLTSSLTFDNKTYNGKVNTKTNFDYLKFSVENPIVKTSAGEVKWNYGLAGMMWDMEVKGNAGGVETTSSKTFGAPVPMVGVNAKANLAKGLNVYANVSGLPLGGYGHIADLEAGFHYEPVENLGLNVGYRMIDVDLQHKDDSASFKLAGPFAGLSYYF